MLVVGMAHQGLVCLLLASGWWSVSATRRMMDTVATTRSLWKSGMLPAITSTFLCARASGPSVCTCSLPCGRYEMCWPAIMRDADGVILVYNPDNRAHEKEIEIWCVVATVSMRIVAWCCPILKLDDCTGTSSSAGKPALKIAAALHSHTRLPPAPSPARVRIVFPANVSTRVACLTAIIVCAVCFACVCVCGCGTQPGHCRR